MAEFGANRRCWPLHNNSDFFVTMRGVLSTKESVMSKVPTDSVLRRHYEQMQQAARDVPTDSVLRRHHEQMQQAARSSAGPARAPEPAEPASTPPEPPASQPEPAPAPEPAPSRPAPAPAASGQGGGFLGWLKRLFGG